MPALPPLLLALDTGSPVLSVALARGGRLIACRTAASARSSSLHLALLRDALAEAGARPADLAGVIALRGPGSFTGLRIGLATALGFHQALGVPATALDTLEVLAAQAAPASPAVVVAVVDALRGEWSARAFAVPPPGQAGALPRPLGDMALVAGGDLPAFSYAAAAAARGEVVIAGFGAGRLAALPGWPAALRLADPAALPPAGSLAAVAVRLASPADAWDPARLTAPIYSRPPAATPPPPREPAPAVAVPSGGPGGAA